MMRAPLPSLRPSLALARRFLVPITLFVAAAFLAWFVNEREKFSTWLLWPYLGFAAATVAWVICCASIGHAALRLLPPLGVGFRERLLFDLATGVLLFAFGLFVAGVFRLLRPPFYFVFPLALAAVGVPASFRDWRRTARHLGAARRRARLRPSWIERAAFAAMTLSFAVVYLSIMVPENTAFDARSYHLPLAEHFAAGGRIDRFPEGWGGGMLPHLASWLYTWPFTLRSVNLFGHVELAAHLELALFVATVLAAPLLVEAIRPGTRARGAGAVFFLFPGLFLYDSSLGIAADHVLAFWAAPLALATWRFARQPTHVGRGALVGLMMAGAALTKYQAVYLLVPAAIVVAFSIGRALLRARDSSAGARMDAPPPLAPWRALAAFAVALLAATAPFWLANLIWHGDPLYPLLRRIFPAHPVVRGWAGMEPDHQFELTGPLPHKIAEAAKAVFTFSFVPNDWFPFHRDLPVFGFLFTLTLPVLLFGRGAGRARVLAGATLLGVFIWYWTYHEDRYLQALLPWMVATTTAALQIAWAAGVAARAGAALLVALQVTWGGDVPWLPTHAMMRDVPAIRALQRLSSTFRGEGPQRFTFDTGFDPLDRSLPRHAYVVLHEEYLRLGLNRRAIQDSLRLQAGIDYRQLGRPDRVDDLLKSFGATHLVWGDSSPNREIPVSGELVFWDYALHYGEDRSRVGGFTVAKLPSRRPPPREPGPVAFIGCGVSRLVPLAAVDALVKGDNRGAGDVDPAAAISAASFVVVDSRCRSRVPPALLAPFEPAPRWGELELWIRRL